MLRIFLLSLFAATSAVAQPSGVYPATRSPGPVIISQPGTGTSTPGGGVATNAIANNNGQGTNTTIMGPFRVLMPPSIYGANTDMIGVGTNGPNSMDVFGGAWRFLFGSGGYNFRDQATDRVFMLGTRTLPLSQPFAYSTLASGEINQVDSGGYGRQPAGAGVTTYMLNQGGDGAGLRSLPVRGPELWRRLPYPFVHIVGWYDGGGLTTLWAATNITSQMVTNMVTANVANGLLQAFTNRGIPVYAQIDAVWMGTNRNASGDLTVRSNQFPGGIEAPVAHAKAAGFKVQAGIYWHNLPTNFWVVDPAGNYDASLPRYQTMTAQTVNNDVLSFYQYGFDAIRMANTIPFYDTAGYQNQMVRQVADAVMNPNGFPWQRSFPTNPMVLNVLLGDNRLGGFSETTLLSANYVESDSEVLSTRTSPPKTILSDIFTNLVYLWEGPAYLCGKGHYATRYVVSDPASGITTPMPTNQWRTDVAFGALWGSGLQFNTNQVAWQIADVTNSNVMRIYFDSEQHPAWVNDRFRDTQLVAVKPLSKGDYYIMLFNDSPTNKTFTLTMTNLFTPPLTWTPLQRPPSVPETITSYTWTDAFNRTNFGNFTTIDTISVTVEPTNSLMILATKLNNTATFSTITPIAVASTGWTNIWSTNNAVVRITGAAATYTILNRDMSTLDGPFGPVTGTFEVHLQPGQSITNSGTSTGTARPF